jgi:hypothetical protein
MRALLEYIARRRTKMQELTESNATLLQVVGWLFEYKSIANEVLSAISKMEFTDPAMLLIKEQALRALNKGAQDPR